MKYELIWSRFSNTTIFEIDYHYFNILEKNDNYYLCF